MTEDELRALFDSRRQQRFEPRLEEVSGSYRFDIDGIGSFFVSVDHGWLVVGEAERAADCIVRSSAEDFLRIARGQQNLLTAAMQGLVEIRGDLGLAQKLHSLMPSPDEADARPGAQP